VSRDPIAVEDVVLTTDCETAEEFLGRLSPLDPFWRSDPTAWIFRGHADSEWKLLSTLHRGDIHELGKWGLLGENERNLSDDLRRTIAERILWNRFRDAIDEAGLEIPGAPVQIERSLRSTSILEIPDDGIPLVALAQHFELPTSLLDWSRIAFKGAYFAASDLSDLGQRGTEGRLAVWCLKKAALSQSGSAGGRVPRLVTAPLASNPNLHAQSGIFTQVQDGKARPLEDFIRERVYVDPALTAEVPVPWMRKVTLPRTCSAEVMRLLSHQGIHGSSMFPGYAGVVRRLREEAV
jgi:hypothetical protein